MNRNKHLAKPNGARAISSLAGLDHQSRSSKLSNATYLNAVSFLIASYALITLTGCSPKADAPAFRGIEGRYALHYTAQSLVNLDAILRDPESKAPTQPSQQVSTDISGTWVVTPLPKEGGENVCRLRLEGISLSLGSNGQPAAGLDRIKDELSQNFYAHLTPEGRVTGVQFDKSWGGNSRDIAKTLLSMAQFVGPQRSDDGKSWQTREDYFGGVYTMQYGVLKDDAGKVTKERIGVEASKNAKGMMATHGEPSGVLDCEFDPKSGLVKSIAGQWKHSIFVGKNTVGNESVRFDLHRLGDLAVDDASGQPASGEPFHPISEFEIAPDQKLVLAKQAMGSATKESLLATVSRLRGKDAASIDLNPMLTQLVGLFQVEPTDSAEFANAVSGSKAGNADFELVMNALVRAGDAPAQSSLVAIGRASNDHDVRGTIVSSLATIERPTPELVQFVTEQTSLGDDKLAQASWLSMGVLASALAKTDPASAGKLVDSLQAEYAKSQTPMTRSTMVLALGNSASPSAMPAIRSSIVSKDPTERRSAIQALAKFPSADSLTLLTDRAQNDPSPAIRAVAIRQMRWQAYVGKMQASLAAILRSEKEETVKTAVLDYLRDRPLSQDLKSALRPLATADPSQTIKAAATTLLKE